MALPLVVALTGANGFVGGHVLAQLLAQSHRVRALVRYPMRSRLKVSGGRLTVVEGSLFDDGAMIDLCDGVDAVIHLVGIIMEKPSGGQTFERVHVHGTTRLIAAASKRGAQRWVQMSALGARPDAASTYHRTKWEAECSVRQGGMPYTIFRPSIIHGPDGQFMKMVKGFWCKHLPPGIVPYFGAGPLGRGGAGQLQPVWVEDVARCIVDAVTNEKSIDEIYPMGGPDTYSWPQFYETCRRHLPGTLDKRIVAVPVWYARLIAGLPLVPFNRDQVLMSQEDSVCQIGKVEGDFDVKLAPFEETFAAYAPRISV